MSVEKLQEAKRKLLNDVRCMYEGNSLSQSVKDKLRAYDILCSNILDEFVALEQACVIVPRKPLIDKYRKLCKTRISNIADDAVCFFIEELTDSEPEELLEKEKTK